MRGLFKNCSRTVQEPIAVIIGDHGKIIQNAKKRRKRERARTNKGHMVTWLIKEEKEDSSGQNSSFLTP